MSYNLFLDDERFPRDVKWVELPPVVWFIVRSYDEFVKLVTEKGCPNIVTFDHDLADAHYRGQESSEKTGYDCAKWLVSYCMNGETIFPKYYVHSLNPIGKENIITYIESYKRTLKL